MSLDNPQMQEGYNPDAVMWKEVGLKAALCGVIAGGAASIFVPTSSSVNVLGFELPGNVAIGLGVGVGSVAGDLAHKFILPYVPIDKRFENAESAAVSLTAAVGGSYLALSMMGDIPFSTSAILGASSYLGGDYVYRNVFDSEKGGFII